MRNLLNINDNWSFQKDCSIIPTSLPDQGEVISLPHTWNGKDGQDGGNDYFRGTCCYTKMIKKEELPEGDCYFIEINGANASADLYLNGTHLAHHDGGYSTWRVDLTDYLQEENCIGVLVENIINEIVYPQTADFTFYGGIYRDVNIVAVEDTHFTLDNFGGTGIYVTPVVEKESVRTCDKTDDDYNNDSVIVESNSIESKSFNALKIGNTQVNIRTEVTNLQAGNQIHYTIYDQEGNLVTEKISEQLEESFNLNEAHLWHGTKDPYLYTAKASIIRKEGCVDKLHMDDVSMDEKSVNEVPIDQVSARFGCRHFEIHPEKGFLLNGEEYPLRGVSRHQDRWEIGNALLPEHHVEDMDLICEMGANTIRLAHYQHDQYFYDLCDERGMTVWAEIPYISRHMPTGNENTVVQMKELILQCYNHPSIVVWGLSNEITMDGAKDPDLIQNHHVLNDLVHEMDKTRPTVIACISMCGMDEEYVHIPDVVSYNHYFGWYGGSHDEYGPWFDKFHSKYPNTPIGVSEYGCEALNWHNSKPEAGDYSEEYQAIYHESLIRQLFTRQYLWATHVWNMFDFGADARAEGGENGQNHKGLITIDRKYKKDAFYAYKAWLSDEPFVHLCGKRYVDRVEEVTKVTVYSNLPEVELFANGESLGKKQAEDHFFYFEVPNVGETELVAVAGEHKDSGRIRKVETMNPDYILREQGAVLNWFDITEIDGRFSLNDKIGEIMKTFMGKIWFARLFLILAKKQSGPKDKNQKKEGGSKEKKVPKKKNTPQMDSGVMNMIGGFTVLRFIGMLGMRNITFTKEELLKMNRQLNKIKKPRA